MATHQKTHCQRRRRKKDERSTISGAHKYKYSLKRAISGPSPPDIPSNQPYFHSSSSRLQYYLSLCSHVDYFLAELVRKCVHTATFHASIGVVPKRRNIWWCTERLWSVRIAEVYLSTVRTPDPLVAPLGQQEGMGCAHGVKAQTTNQ